MGISDIGVHRLLPFPQRTTRGERNYMSVTYNKTKWVNEVTQLDADNMNNIENGIERLVNEVNNSAITVDSELSETSKNPVQNKTIKAALGDKVDKIEGYRMMSPDEASKLESLVAGEGGNVPNIELINGGNANGNT